LWEASARARFAGGLLTAPGIVAVCRGESVCE
jgi:hypothetical protein